MPRCWMRDMCRAVWVTTVVGLHAAAVAGQPRAPEPVCEAKAQCGAVDWWQRRGKSCSLVLSQPTEHVVPCALAVFAPVLPEASTAPLVRAPDRLACAEFNETAALAAAGKVVLATRGECSMLDKVMVAQRAGAVGLVVANHDDGPAVRMVSPKFRAKRGDVAEALPRIPTVMITRAHAKHVRALLKASVAGADLGGRAELRVRLQPSFETAPAFEREATMWQQVLAAKAPATQAAAHRVWAWNQLRAGWTDDGERALAFADALRANHTEQEGVYVFHGFRAKRLSMRDLVPKPEDGQGPPASMGLPDQLHLYQELVQLYPRVCEVGFDYGINALVTLESGAQSYLGFDGNNAAHSFRSATELQDEFGPGRFRVLFGDTTETIGRHAYEHFGEPQCDFVLITGARAKKGDLESVAALVAPEHILVFTDTPCSSDRCRGPTMAWDLAEETGSIRALHRQFYSPPGQKRRSRGFSVGTYVADGAPTERNVIMKLKGESYESLGMEAPMGSDTDEYRNIPVGP